MITENMTSTITEFSHLQIPLEEIAKATNNFADENIIGKGGFGNVYKGQLLRSGELMNVAARRLDRKYGQGDVEFWTEISVLSSFKRTRQNVVSLIGFCDEKGEKIIISSYNAKGSLSVYISDPTTLTWMQRLNISNSIILAIGSLDTRVGPNYYIIHRNINSSTILLDERWEPSLSGFEYSIKHPIERRNQVFLCDAIGTTGYMDPATEKSGGVTHKSDIYSMGVVLFEMLCGRKANEDNRLLAPLAKRHYENGTLQEIIHPDLWNQMEPESVKSFAEAAYLCLAEVRAHRPDAFDIVGKINWAQDRQREYENDQVEEEKEDEEKEDALSYGGGYIGDVVESASSIPSELKNFKHLHIELEDIKLATENFNKRYSTWNSQFHTLYKAELECFDREYHFSLEGNNNDELPKRQYTVIIKPISDAREFYTEIEILNRCKHRNIESLLGFCVEGPYMLLVYEYVSRDYLNRKLLNRLLTWEKRLKICIDVAYGLDYLHNNMEDQKMVIHRYINSHSIVLDENWRAKIVNFGLSIFLPPNQDDDALHLNEIKGSKYNSDPEYVETGKLKRESDVFSFGTLMLEILYGYSAYHIMLNENLQDKGLTQLMRRWLENGIIKKHIVAEIKAENCENDTFINKGPNEDSLDTFIKIAYQCLAEKQHQRPNIKAVIHELEKSLFFQENDKDIFRMSLEDIKLATRDFSRDNYIGGGGFGRVYKGELPRVNGNGHFAIVAKQLDTRHGQGEQQFYNELRILHEYKHENVIGLIGYSNETDEKIIVYEHAPKGSLDKYLHDSSLTWRNRLNICIDFANGLDFLHGGVHGQEVVIHRDIKAANILLFDDWKAKIGDFGLSMISTINKETDFVIDHACGTKGYLDPLYLKSGFLTIESDIYSFGVVLFEILCGRTTYAIHRREGKFLPSFVKHIFEEGNEDHMVFEAIKDDIVPKSLKTFQNIAYRCLDDDRTNRPTAKEVLLQLKKALKFQVECWFSTTSQSEISNMKSAMGDEEDD